MFTLFLFCVSSAKVYIDKKLKRNDARAPDDLIGDILETSRLSKKELYAAITELQIGGVETVSYTLCCNNAYLISWMFEEIYLLLFWELLGLFSMKLQLLILILS